MKRFRILAFIVVTAGLLATGSSLLAAGDDYSGISTDAGRFEKKPFKLTIDLRFGYDSNVNTTYFNPHSSGFFNLGLNGTYTASNARSNLTIGAGVNFVFYFDPAPNTKEFQVNANISLSWTYKITPRASIAVSTYNLYGTQPEFTVVGLNTRVAGNYFYSSNRLAFAYQFTPRFSTVTSFTPIIVRYEDEPYKTQQDRIEYYLSEEFRFLIRPTVSLVAEYRFAYIDYSKIDLNDSTVNYILAGFDATLSPRLKASLRGGAEFRDYRYGSQAQVTSPYFEGSLAYDYKKNSNIAFILRYGIEQTDITGTVYRQGFRMGLNLRHQLTPRISLSSSFYYTNAYYVGNTALPLLNPGNFTENIYDVAVGARYAISRNWSLDLGYLYTFVDSPLIGRSYNRNRVFAGVRFQF